MKKHIKPIILVIVALISISIDMLMKSKCTTFNEINRILFTLITVIAGFWVTCYLLFLQLYKDRYPLSLIKNRYLFQMKYNVVYITYSIIFGCIVIIKNGGIVENICYTITSLITIFIVIKQIYDTSKTLMLNTYVDDFCAEISEKLNAKENSIKKEVFKELRYVLDECIVKEEYSVAQNISKRLGEVFQEFLSNAYKLLSSGEGKKEIEDSFERIVSIGMYQLQLCKDINSDLLVLDITKQQKDNICFCIESGQYEWFKLYIEKLKNVTFRAQRNGNDKLVADIFPIFFSVLDRLIESEKEEWITYMVDELFSMTKSLNFQSSNINLKYFASLITYGLLNCMEGKIYEYLYGLFEEFTNIASRISNGFSDTKIYYALYFNDIIKKDDTKKILRFFEMIFENGQDNGTDVSWTEFKFYCIGEVQEKYDALEKDIDRYHIRLLVSVIEMKDKYKEYMFFPPFKKKLCNKHYEHEIVEEICEDIAYLLHKCIINDNLNFFTLLLKFIFECMCNTEMKDKNLQIELFDLYIWLIGKTKRLNNKQYIENVFIELDELLKELDKKGAISSGFGDTIVSKLSDTARQADSDSQLVVFQVVELFSGFLKEGDELHFISTSLDRKEKLYRGLFNIAISCIENDFEEGLRRCSNAMGWFLVYSIKQGNSNLSSYLIKLSKSMLEIAIEMNISTKTQAFILTLFTTVGMYCCKDAINLAYAELIISAIENVDKNLVYTAIRMRTYENDMWDDLFEKKTSELTVTFKKRYDEHQKKRNGVK